MGWVEEKSCWNWKTDLIEKNMEDYLEARRAYEAAHSCRHPSSMPAMLQTQLDIKRQGTKIYYLELCLSFSSWVNPRTKLNVR